MLGLGYKLEVTLIRHQVLSTTKMTNEETPDLLGLLPMILGLTTSPLSPTNAINI